MRIAPVIAVLSLLSIAGSAATQTAAPDQIADLNRICIAAAGDGARAAELALAAGYSPTPPELTPERRNMRDVVGLLKTSAEEARFVLIARSTRRLGREEVTLNVCGVGVRPTDHQALRVRVRQMIGFDPVREGGVNGEIWAWLLEQGARAPVRNLNDANLANLAATGRLKTVSLMREGPGSLLMYATAQTED